MHVCHQLKEINEPWPVSQTSNEPETVVLGPGLGRRGLKPIRRIV
jgi:hypothetical protein